MGSGARKRADAVRYETAALGLPAAGLIDMPEFPFAVAKFPNMEVNVKQFSIVNTANLIVLCFLGVCCSSQMRAQGHGLIARDQYSVASVCGDYSAIATYGPNIARALGFEVMDGHGNIRGAATVNQPGSDDTTRSISRIGISGTYTVEEDGSGKMDLSIALPGGGSASVSEDFVITKTKTINGVLIATEIEDMQEVPSAVIDNSSLVIHRYTLRRVLKSCVSGR